MNAAQCFEIRFQDLNGYRRSVIVAGETALAPILDKGLKLDKNYELAHYTELWAYLIPAHRILEVARLTITAEVELS